MVDIKDTVHAGHADHHRVLLRDRAAGERCAGAARHHRHTAFGAEFEDRGDLIGRIGQDNGQRHAAIGGERVGFERHQFARIGDQALVRDQRRKPVDDLSAPGDDAGIGLKKCDFVHGALLHSRQLVKNIYQLLPMMAIGLF